MTSPWQSAKKILAIRLDACGDVLMCTPALRALKSAAPDRSLTLLTSTSGALAGSRAEGVDQLIVYSAPWMKAGSVHPESEDAAMIATLKEQHFEGAVIFTSYSQSPLPAAMLSMLAGIPLRLAHCHENPYRLLTNWVRDPEPEKMIRHEVKRQLDLVESIGATSINARLQVRISEAERNAVMVALEKAGIDGSRDWLLLHPGATAASRRYPPLLWAQVAELLSAQTSLPLVFSGNTDEISLVQKIQDATNCKTISLAGQLNFGEMAALVERAAILVSNNSAPVHLAAATNTPVVDLYALTNPQHTPWLVPNRVLFQPVPCQYCYQSVCNQPHHPCLSGIEPQSVVNATVELLYGSEQ